MRLHFQLFIVLFLKFLVLFTRDNFVVSFRTLPVNLQECYANNGTFAPNLPLNLQTVIDIIRKLERRTHTSMSMRTLSAALVKRFKLDGIKFSKEIPEAEGVVRYAATGEQRAKHRIVERVIPGDQVNQLPENSLTQDERCLLHLAMSNTIWDSYEPEEERYCGPGPTASLLADHRSVRQVTDKCPKEVGVILTPYNTIALGSVVAAIAAALEPQIVKTSLLLAIPVDELDEFDESKESNRFQSDDVDFVLPKEQMIADRNMWMESVKISNTQIDNVWIATIAGELAEMVIYQGPVYEERMYLGATGFWNNTLRPRAYYVSHRMNNFEFTRAEVIGAIDGLIIAKNLEKWMRNFENLRLSQVLDMYYSDKGIVFDKSVKACHRAQQFPSVGPKTIMEEQTYAASQVLAYLNSIASMTDEALQQLVVRAVANFDRYTEDRLFTEYQCRGRRRNTGRIQVIIAIDGSWTPSYTTDFLAVLVDDFEVSRYGSRMALINGQTGDWLIETTDSPSNIYQAINNFTKITWPSGMKLSRVFKTVTDYLDDSWTKLRDNNTIGSIGQAVVLLLPQITLTNEETQLALTALKILKSKHPETRFLYYTHKSKTEILKPFILSDEDRIVDSLEIDDISRILTAVPSTLRPVGCNKNIPGVRLQLEDYISPLESKTYRLHPQWRIKGKRVTLTIHGVGYGTLKVCWWNQMTINSEPIGKNCKDLGLYTDLSFSDNYVCDGEIKCPNTYFQIYNVTTTTRCTEIDCRTPDQVRYIMRMESFQCPSSSEIISINMILLITLLTFATLLD